MDLEDDSCVSSGSDELSPSHVPASLQAPVPSPGSQKRRARRKTRHPAYRGVRERSRGKWVCEMREPHKKSRIWLGTYPTPEMAAKAYDVAAIALHGDSARLNFPDSARALPRPCSASSEDIRLTAMRAAEMHRAAVCSPTPPPDGGVTELSKLGKSSIRIDSKGTEKVAAPAAAEVFVDDEALFNMPGLVDSMAEGLLLTPPAMQKGFDWDAADYPVDLTLWSDDSV